MISYKRGIKKGTGEYEMKITLIDEIVKLYPNNIKILDDEVHKALGRAIEKFELPEDYNKSIDD